MYNSDGSAYANKYSIQAAYDDKSRISVAVYSIDYPSASAYTENLQVGYHFAYDEENRLSFSYAEIIPSSMLPDYNEDEPVYMQYYTAYSYDKFNRLSGTNLSVTIDEYTPNLSVSTNYTYEVSNGQATSRVATYSTNIGGTATGYRYSYDAKGNITEIRSNSTFALIASFTYDNLSRLTRENNAQLGKTYTYTYDNAGNITSKKTYAYTVGTLGSVQDTKLYTYGNNNWGDQLTAYNGATITYDASGNPLTYNNGSSYTFTWTPGRRLASATKGTTSLSFKYNESGIRTTKTVGTVVHEYILDGTKIVAEKWGVNGVTHLVEYIYDANSVIGMIYHNNTMSVDSFEQYVFEKNLQGDIVAVYNATGTKLVAYTYDAWGNVTTTYYNGGASNGAQYNSLRYRGYYYDTETGLYYLNSRYYDPATGRFINADAFINANGDLTGFNMYAYCSNNPVMFCDCSGMCIHNGTEHLTCKICRSLQSGDDPTSNVVAPPKSHEFEVTEAEGLDWWISTGKIIDSQKFGIDAFLEYTKSSTVPLGKYSDDFIRNLDCATDFLGNASTSIDILITTSEIFYNINQNVSRGASWNKIAYDVSVDVFVVGTSSIANYVITGWAVGSTGGIPGMLIGAGVGIGLGLVEHLIFDVLGLKDAMKGWYEG